MLKNRDAARKATSIVISQDQDKVKDSVLLLFSNYRPVCLSYYSAASYTNKQEDLPA